MGKTEYVEMRINQMNRSFLDRENLFACVNDVNPNIFPHFMWIKNCFYPHFSVIDY